MEAEKEKVCEGAEYAFITDIRITLECLPIHPNDQGTMQYNGIV